jgi:hypothetical protein
VTADGCATKTTKITKITKETGKTLFLQGWRQILILSFVVFVVFVAQPSAVCQTI